jgi:hypothetical protein
MATNDNTGGKPSGQERFASGSSADSTATADSQPSTPDPTLTADAETSQDTSTESTPATDEAETSAESASETPTDETAEAETAEPPAAAPQDQGGDGTTNPSTVPQDTTPPETPIQEPSETLSEREAKLRAVQKAHEEWVASNVNSEPPATLKTPDANQFAMDTNLPQEDLLARVDKNTKDVGADPLDNAVERLNELLKREGLDKKIQVRRTGE